MYYRHFLTYIRQYHDNDDFCHSRRRRHNSRREPAVHVPVLYYIIKQRDDDNVENDVLKTEFSLLFRPFFVFFSTFPSLSRARARPRLSAQLSWTDGSGLVRAHVWGRTSCRSSCRNRTYNSRVYYVYCNSVSILVILI